MTAQSWGTLLVYFAAPPATLFPLLYGFTAPWWASIVGRALMTVSIGLGLLVDISLLFHWLGPTYRYHDSAVLVSFAVVGVGSWMCLGAFVEERWFKHWRHHRVYEDN